MTFSFPRSVLYVPASQARMLARAPGAGADALIVDLEDGVSPAEKEAARRRLRSSGGGARFGDVPWMLRINPAGTPWHDEDLVLAAELRPPLVVIPKAEEAATVRRLASAFVEHGSEAALMIETARGVGEARRLAGCHPGVRVLVLGSADLRLSLGARPDPERAWERHALSETLLAARMHGAAAVDSVYFRHRDDEGLRRHARIARDLGYDGKSCIHPAQVATIHEIFASTPDEIDWAHRVLQAWESLGGARRGVVVVDGEMVEALHLTVARRILARAAPSAGGKAGG